ncbi:sure-like protein [Irpex rosettiformis]|uniref:Sure-like protein n=1 Tax=Irpex rosettiformis TaxID=378272 RepID=A0ACB8TU38_9APHY|nr:sure-like protein [Irpex rosettiformis]
MNIFPYVQIALSALNATTHYPTKLVLTNDDGWAVAQIRAQNDALKTAGFDVILSAPAENQSGSGSRSATPRPLTKPCQFDTCPIGSPAKGYNSSDPRLNYVNSFPVDAARFGIRTLSPQIFGSAPDFVLSGPNIGNNLGLAVLGSGTVGAACEAAKEGIPAIAVSGESTSSVSYSTLLSDPNSPATLAALLNSQLTAKFLNALLASHHRPILPRNIIVNVNFSPPNNSSCSGVDDYKFIFTRLLPDPLHLATDVTTCGTDHLPDERSVIRNRSAGCRATVSVISALTKLDVGASTQAAVLDRVSNILSCA